MQASGHCASLVGYVLWTADQLASLARAATAATPALAPRLAACYKIAMGLAMGYMLIMTL